MSRKSQTPENPESVFDMDLTKLTPAGWLLLLSCFGWVGVFAVVAALFLPGGEGNRGPMKLIGGAAAVALCGYFFAGRAVLNALGFPILRPDPKPPARRRRKRRPASEGP